MIKPIRAQLSQLVFPKTCVVCLSPSSREFKLEGTISYGRRSYTVKVPVPMCELHFQAATFKSPAERFVNWVAVYGGIFFGLACAILAVFRWVTDEHIVVKILSGGIFGLGAFIIFWWFVSAAIAPQFASSGSKEARNAVRITGYWPQNQIVQLEFKNESLAEMMLKSS